MAFFWEGNTGGITTPQQAARKRAISEAMLGQSRSGANNWGEGLARVAQALTGTVLEGRASDAERAGADEVAALLAGLSPESGFGDISAALANPWLAESPGGSAIASALLGENMRRSDPMYGIGLEKAQLELERLRNPGAPEPIKVGDVLLDPITFQPLYDGRTDTGFTLSPGQQRFDALGNPIASVDQSEPNLTSAIQNYEYLRAQGVGEPEAMQQAFGAGSTTVNVNTGNTDDFFSGLSSAEGEQFAGMLAAGTQAARTSQQLDQLEGLLANSPQGFEGAATAFASNFGIDLGGAQGVQAAQALINQLVPAQRPPGSGPMSDADLELFKQSLPRIINQPGGNELIMQTMRAMTDYDRQLAAIVQDGISQAELTDDPALRSQIRRNMRTAIDQLQNPIDAFRQRAGSFPSASSNQGTAPIPAPQSQANPAILDWKDL